MPYFCFRFHLLMLRNITAIMFLLAFAWQTFNKAFIVLDYYSDTSSYAQKCENKAKPKMHCNGKCQMMKKLKEEQKKEERNPERKAENKNEYIVSSKSFFPSVPRIFFYEKLSYPELTVSREVKISATVFHPPSIG